VPAELKFDLYRCEHLRSRKFFLVLSLLKRRAEARERGKRRRGGSPSNQSHGLRAAGIRRPTDGERRRHGKQAQRLSLPRGLVALRAISTRRSMRLRPSLTPRSSFSLSPTTLVAVKSCSRPACEGSVRLRSISYTSMDGAPSHCDRFSRPRPNTAVYRATFGYPVCTTPAVCMVSITSSFSIVRLGGSMTCRPSF
jgi:hypothetical protein